MHILLVTGSLTHKLLLHLLLRDWGGYCLIFVHRQSNLPYQYATQYSADSSLIAATVCPTDYLDFENEVA